MRAVSLSSAPVRKKLSEDFVCYVINTEGDPSAGSSQGHAPRDAPGLCAEGIGNQNVQTIFLTPAGEIFHTASGYRKPEEFLAELNFAKKLFDLIREKPEQAQQSIKTSHRNRMKLAGYTDEVLDRRPSRMNPFADMMESMPRLTQSSSQRNMPFDPQGMNDKFFAGKTRMAQLLDYRFIHDHPLMPFEEFEQNPRLLVGNATTAFASGPASGGQIGGNPGASNSAKARSF